MTVEVLVLGPVAAVVDGRPVPIGSARQRAVLAALALEHGRTVSVDALTEALWGEALPQDARGTIQSYVSRLRARLGEQTIVHDGDGYRLDVPPEAVDVVRLEQLRRRGHDAWRSAPADAAACFDAALDLWRGPALGELADQPAFLPDRTRLDELRRALADDAAEAHLDAGHTDLLPALERAAAAEPLRERTQRLLMRALAAQGRTAEALRVADRYRRRLAEETGLDPSDELTRLERSLLQPEAARRAGSSEEPVPPATAAPRAEAGRRAHDGRGRTCPGCPCRVGRFVGRARELADLAVRMARDRVVTVVGPGGIGKTRLVAEWLAGRDPDDVAARVVELAALADDADVAAAVAEALDRAVPAGRSLDALAESLGLERLVVVLDNCEHVLASVRPLVARIATSCPDVRVLATSRVRLGLAEEQVVVLDGLPHADAVALYADRVGRAATVRPADGPLVDRICARLEGVPLAVELAAGTTATLGLAGLHDRLGTLLGGPDPGDPSPPGPGPDVRHRTLAAVVEWSYALLDPSAQALLDALSVFEHGFGLDAAEHVGAVVVAEPVPAVLCRLVDASLVLADHAGERVRYRMLETVAAYGTRRLVGRGLDDVVRAAHLGWLAAFVERTAAGAAGPGEAEAWARIDEERDNLRAVLRWALAHPAHVGDAARVAMALARASMYRADGEILEWVRRVAADPHVAGTPFEAGVLAAGSRAAWLQGDLDAAHALASRALALGPGDAAVAAHALGVHHLYRGDHAEAERWWRRAAAEAAAGDAASDRATDTAEVSGVAARADAVAGIALARCYAGDLAGAEAARVELAALAEALDSATYRAFARYVEGELAALRDPGGAVAILRSALDRARAARADFVAGVAGTALLSLLVRHGRRGHALDEVPGLVELWWRSSTWPQLWTTLRLLAELLEQAGDARTAVLLLEAAERDPAAPAVVGADADRLRALRDRLHDELGPEAWEAVRITAGVLPRAGVVRRALDAVEALGTSAPP